MLNSPRIAQALLLPLFLWEIVALLLKAGRQRFWYDELLTLQVSALHPDTLWKALRAGVDGMPPGYYAIVKLARMLPLDPHVTLRVPSIACYLLTLIGVYCFARKRLAVLPAAVAVLLLSLSPFRAFALEARSYALLVGFVAISLCLWQRAEDKRYMTPLLGCWPWPAIISP